jgi:hypothetical protein
MGGRLGLGGRVVFAALLAGTLLFVATGTVNADPSTWTISIGNASPASSPEGDSPGANSLTFPVTVTGPSATPDVIDVSYSSSETLTPAFSIPANTDSGTTLNMQVPINGNTTPEADRTMTVTLNGGTIENDTTDSVAVGTASGTGSIVDDDWRITGLTSSPANATVSEAGGGTIDFQISLNAAAPANHPIKIDYALGDGSGAGGAKFGTDYTVTNDNGKQHDTLTFAPGSSHVDVIVQGINDGVYGYDKTFTMTISNPQGASFAGGATTSGNGTITESSAAPIIGFATPCGTATGGNVLSIPLGTSFASPIPATVTWTITDGTTIAGDFASKSGTATVPAGTRNGSISIQTNENPPPGSRTFTVTLSNPQQVKILSGGGSTTCTLTQPANAGTDRLPSLQLTNPSPVAQPVAGGSAVTVPISVTLNPPVIQPATQAAVNVHWSTQAGTAATPADFTTAAGDLHWDAGKFTTQAFNVQVNPATGTANAPKTFTINFQTTDAGYVNASTVTVTIVPPASPPVVSAADASALESAGSIPAVVSLAPSSTGTVTVQYATADGSAKAGTDYTAVNGTLTFAAGQTSKTVLVPITNNSQPGTSTSFTFKLSNPTNALIGNATATLTIRDDDATTPKPPIVGDTGPPSPPQTKPIAVGPHQPNLSNGKHVVLVQVLTGTSTVDPKGFAHFKLSCPAPAVKTCQGTVMLQVRIQPKKPKGAKKAPALQTVTIGSGTFKIRVASSASVKVRVTKQGLALLEAYRRFKVKATVTAKDAQNVKGVTAWFVTVQAPARAITIKTK